MSAPASPASSSDTESIDPPAPARARRARPSRFFRVLFGLTVLMHVFFGAAVLEALHRFAIPHAGWWACAMAVLGLLAFINRVRLIMPDRHRSPLVVRFFDIPFYVHFCAAFFTLVPALLASIVWPLVSLVRDGELGAGAWPGSFILGTYLLGLLMSGYGVLVRRRWFVIDRIEVPVAGLDPKLDGFRIVQLSDLHVGALTPRSWADRWVAAANAEKGDLAVVTGDMVTSGVDFHDDIAKSLGGLRARHGSVVSMGNHDYFGEGEPLITRLRENGCAVLRNQGRVIEQDGASFYLAAIDDTWTRRADLDRALVDRPAGMPCVLLAHEPAMFDHAADKGVALTLSGHTHGGQVAMPFLAKRLSLSHLTNRYHLGVYQKNDAVLYVHPGLGTTGPPIRIGVAPAVTVITLRAR